MHHAAASVINDALPGAMGLCDQFAIVGRHEAVEDARRDYGGGGVAATQLGGTAARQPGYNATAVLALPDWGRTSIAQETRLADPALWSLDTPQLYSLVSTIVIAGAAVDRTVSRFGIRTIRFDPDHGFFLNGAPVKIKGTCNHQDHAGVGFAVPDSLHVWRLEQLKAMGSNAYRSTHHSPSPAILDACDAMGILMIDETRQMSSNNSRTSAFSVTSPGAFSISPASRIRCRHLAS